MCNIRVKSFDGRGAPHLERLVGPGDDAPVRQDRNAAHLRARARQMSGALGRCSCAAAGQEFSEYEFSLHCSGPPTLRLLAVSLADSYGSFV